MKTEYNPERCIMSTPESKVQLHRGNSCSKYLTPCRTFGLKRKSTSPRTPCSSKVVCRTGDTISFESAVALPLQNIENKVSENLSHHNVALNMGEDKKKKNFKCKAGSTPFKQVSLLNEESHAEKNESKELILDTKLLGTIQSVNSKIEKINILKRNGIYVKKHDINELRKSTEKWKRACKDVILEIHQVMKSRGHDVSVSSILDQHNIPYDYIGFNIETMDFD